MGDQVDQSAADAIYRVENGLNKIEKLLREILAERERPLDYDQTFVVSNGAAIGVVPIVLPRTLKHVEIWLSSDSAATVVVFAGQQSLAAASAQYSTAIAGGSTASCSSNGGQIKVRDYLDGSGYLTVYFPAATPCCANVRVRSLTVGKAPGE